MRAAATTSDSFSSPPRSGLPPDQGSRDVFALLFKDALLSRDCATAMKRMVGFRHVAVHGYEQVQHPILEAIVEHYLVDFESFLRELSG